MLLRRLGLSGEGCAFEGNSHEARVQSYGNGAYKHQDVEDYEHSCLALLCMKVAGPISQSIAISALSTAVVKWRKTQKLGIPVCGHARSALFLRWLQLHRRIGGRPIRLFAGAFPSFFDNPDTDRALNLGGLFVLAPPVFCRVHNIAFGKDSAKPICLEQVFLEH